jgi:hypothetical protein
MGRAKPIILSSRTFATTGEAREYFSDMLQKYEPGDRVLDVDAVHLAALLDRHPDRSNKIGIGVDHFEVQSADYASQCFRVVRLDRTWARFSYKACIDG